MTLDWPQAPPSNQPPDRDRAEARAASDRTATDYDVTIVGGSVVGLTLACALLQSGLRVAVVEAQPPEVGAARRQAYAMSLMSQQIFQGLGIWQEIEPQITRFQAVRLSDADYGRTVEFRPQDLDSDAIYYAAEHHVLMSVLQRQVRQATTIDYLCPARLVQVEYGSSSVALQVEQAGEIRQVVTDLLVAADGARSRLRQQANIATDGWKYWQSCITVTLKPEKPHQNIAYERFWPSGPFAILPLPDNRCQIVWTAPHAEAEAMIALDRKSFMTELTRRYGQHMGQLTPISEPLLFRVQLMQSRRYVQPRLALVGDAAHCCHPVGGQGMNMGIRDAAALAQVIQDACDRNQDIGSLTVLKRYERWRRRENFVILGFTDFLDRCFSNRWLPLMVLRRCGLWILHGVQPLKRLALRIMVGQFGRPPELSQRQATSRSPISSSSQVSS